MSMDWDKLRIFYAVAEAGSFTKAGEKLNLSQSAVSRQISGLEDSLQITLFHRHARGLLLTEQGELLYKTVRNIYSQLTLAEGRLKEAKERPSGPLRITTTTALGTIFLTRYIKDFIELYPDIDVSFLLTEDDLDISMRQADVALRMTPPTHPDVVQRHLLSIPNRVFASPEYLKEFGMPRKVEDLDKHRIVCYGNELKAPVPFIDWLLEVGREGLPKRKPFFRVNNTYAIFRSIERGIGIGSLPDYISSEGTNLVQIMQDLRPPTIEVYFVYPEELRKSPRVTVFRDFLLHMTKQVKY